METHDETPSSPRKPGTRILLAAGVLLLLLVALLGALLLGRSDSATDSEDSSRASLRAKNLAELQTADSTQLTTYGWTDRTKGVVRIPVTRAMELLLPSLNATTQADASAKQKQQ